MSGMNVNLYHFRDSWIMVDLGISFPDESTPGVDVILPDLKFIADGVKSWLDWWDPWP